MTTVSMKRWAADAREFVIVLALSLGLRAFIRLLTLCIVVKENLKWILIIGFACLCLWLAVRCGRGFEHRVWQVAAEYGEAQ